MSERWPSGWKDLLKEALDAGFEPWVPKHSRLFADWGSSRFAIGPASWVNDPIEDDRASYGYVGRDTRISKTLFVDLIERYSFVVLDAKHELVQELKNENAPRGLVICASADAFVDWLARETWIDEWIATEMLSAQAEISPTARLEPGVIVGPGSVIEDHVVLRVGVRIGADCRIGAGTDVGAYSVIQDHVHVGKDVSMGPHCVLGTPGLGLVRYPKETAPKLRVHVGSVLIGDRVRMGAYVSVDRGVFDNTVVGADTQIDNHVQIAHNCHLGEADVLCAFVGLAGSTDVGARTTLAGMVGSKGHLSIGSDVVVGAQSGITYDIPDGEHVKGYPVRPMPEAAKIASLTTRLPEIYTRLKNLEKTAKKGSS